MEGTSHPTTFRGSVIQQYRLAIGSDFGGKVAETYITRIAIMALALASTVIISRFLGPQGRGYYAVALATGALGVQFATLGMHTANGYFAAKQPEALPQLMGNALLVSLGVGISVAGGLGWALQTHPRLLGIHGMTLVLGVLWIPIGLAYMLLQSLLLGTQDIRGYNLAEIGSKVIGIALLGIFILTRRASVNAFLIAALLGLSAACLWEGLRLKCQFDGPPRASLTAFMGGMSYAFKAYWAATFCFLVLRADLFMVQHMLGAEQAGYYSIAATMADYVSIFASVVGTILFPKLSSLNDIRRKYDLTKRATIGTGLVLIPFLGIASLFAKSVVRLLFGAAFLPASLSFVSLMPGMLFLGIHAVSVQFLNSIGYPKSIVIIWGFGSLFNVVVNLWAIPRFGIVGASVVSSISYFLVFFFVACVIYREGRTLESFALAS